MTTIVRKGEPKDVASMLELVKELAEFEKALDEVESTIETLTEDAFGNEPLYGFFVAEKNTKIIGIAIYYFRYSTWKGKRLYLEDILVTESERGKGVGSQLFEAIATFAKEQKCNGMNWLVLDWNQIAIQFYKKYNARFEPEWLYAGISKEDLRKF